MPGPAAWSSPAWRSTSRGGDVNPSRRRSPAARAEKLRDCLSPANEPGLRSEPGDSGGHPDVEGFDARRAQRLCTSSDGRSGGHDVVDERHPWRRSLVSWDDHAAQVSSTIGGAQASLDSGVASALQCRSQHRRPDRNADRLSQFQRLIEAASLFSPPVHGHRHQGLRQPRPAGSDLRNHRVGQRPAGTRIPGKFVSVDQDVQRKLIAKRGERAIPLGRVHMATPADGRSRQRNGAASTRGDIGRKVAATPRTEVVFAAAGATEHTTPGQQRVQNERPSPGLTAFRGARILRLDGRRRA